MQTFALISTLLAAALAAPTSSLTTRAGAPAIPERSITYKVWNFSDRNAPRVAEAHSIINAPALKFSAVSPLVAACATCPNQGNSANSGSVDATHVEIVSDLRGVECELTNPEGHVVVEFTHKLKRADLTGSVIEPWSNVEINADGYSLRCFDKKTSGPSCGKKAHN